MANCDLVDVEQYHKFTVPSFKHVCWIPDHKLNSRCYQKGRREVDSAKVLSLYSNLKESAINNIDVVGYLIDIESALAALKPRHRLILTKICIEGYSQSEVAEMLGITKSTINGVYHNALIQFEKEFNHAKEN